MAATFELFQDPSQSWRWRLRDDDGTTIADGTTSYASASECRRVIQRVRQNAFKAELQEAGPPGAYKPSKSQPPQDRRAKTTQGEPGAVQQKNPFNAAA